MIKVLSAEQIQEADKITISKEPVSSIDLMERASGKCADWLLNTFDSGKSFSIFCGQGNNGGDGLAIARFLFQKGKKISVIILKDTCYPSDDFKINLNRLKDLPGCQITELNTGDQFPILEDNSIVIDAIFGSGLNKILEGQVSDCVKHINNRKNIVVAIDIPSGLFADKHTDDLSNVVNANFTLTFQTPKKSFFYPEYSRNVGKWYVLDIGLDMEFIKSVDSKWYLLSEYDILELLRPRFEFAHKGNFGHALLLAGSYGKCGAAILAANACLRSGAGLLTVRCPECCVVPVQTSAPEAMILADDEKLFLSDPVKPGNHTAIGIGPGIEKNKETGNVLKRLIQDIKSPMVFDADALNLLSENPTWLSFIPAGSILTPHLGEFKRLAGNSTDPFERSKKQLEFAAKYNCYVLLKGKYSALACPDGSLIFNPTGNPGMAKGGSGDVLTGILTGFLAQGYTPFQASLLSVYMHGLAGDIAAEQLSQNAMTANDIVEFLPLAFKEIESIKQV